MNWKNLFDCFNLILILPKKVDTTAFALILHEVRMNYGTYNDNEQCNFIVHRRVLHEIGKTEVEDAHTQIKYRSSQYKVDKLLLFSEK